jgi:glycosyltransferase involved in cell wall biosynthesis
MSGVPSGRQAPMPSQMRLPSSPGNWLNVVTHLDPKYGGLSAVVPALAASIAQAGRYSATVTGFCINSEQYQPVASRVEIAHMPLGRINWWLQAGTRHAFQRSIEGAAGVHIHGLWEHSSAAAAHKARGAKKPYIISAHGMLEHWALAHKRIKKLIYAALVERSNLQAASCLHALTEMEAQDYRRFGLRNPIAVIPNGVEVPAQLSSKAFLDRYPELLGKRLILFLGRIHYKKGVHILARAWSQIAMRWPEARLVFAGPDSQDTQCALEQQIDSLGITNRVKFTGMLNAEQKWSALAAADAFVLPSYSEGLSVSVLEAMGAGRPVIVTRECNLPAVSEHGCGWVIEADAGALESTLHELLRSPARCLVAMGDNGRLLVKQRYAWPVIGRQVSELYEWLNGGGMPSDFELHRRVI